jgi:large subunit ribosomal protein L30
MTKIAVVRIRGNFHLSAQMKSAFAHLRLLTKNSCVVVESSPVVLGMINKVKDFVTWGEITEETLKSMESRKSASGAYRLHPPRKGYGKKGIKVAYKVGGSLGDRKDKINDLITRML